MKLNFFSGVLSFLILSPLYAVTTTPPAPPPIVKPLPGPVNLNTADVKTLAKSMKGIGLKRAEAIVKYRNSHEGFKSVEDLALVPGLGKNFVKNHSDEINKVFTLK